MDAETSNRLRERVQQWENDYDIQVNNLRAPGSPPLGNPSMSLVDKANIPVDKSDLSDVTRQAETDAMAKAPPIPSTGPVGYWRVYLYVSQALTALGDVSNMSTGETGPNSGFVHQTFIPGFLSPPDVLVWGNRIFQQAYEDYGNKTLRYTECNYWMIPDPPTV